MTEQQNQPPVERFRSGSVEVAIWERDGKKGKFLTADQYRSYKDADENWQKTRSWRTSDLPHVVATANLAHAYMLKNDQPHQSNDDVEAPEADADADAA